MIRIALVDDHELVRTGFRHILSREADLEVVGEGASGEDGIALARRLAPDVMLMDLHLPGISGLEAIERIARGDGRTRLIAVTAQDEQPFPRRALEAGAAGYLTKACPAEELVRAVRTVARGSRYLSADVARELALASLPGAGQSPFEALSKRELEVALQLARGGDLQGIARLLSLSPKTVATYKYRLFEKLGVDNEVALAQLAQRFGLLGTP
ncbi:MAG: response regulator [Xanthomonadaceae bacterium]|jgi:DNA-binding NarL/FixJ family response regulator|nr:response regulator [Xanthomonadaceae bacterium]